MIKLYLHHQQFLVEITLFENNSLQYKKDQTWGPKQLKGVLNQLDDQVPL